MTTAAPPDPTATVIGRPPVDPAAPAARAREISAATDRLRLAREAETADAPAQEEIITRERPILEAIEREIADADRTIADNGSLVIRISDEQTTRYTLLLNAEDAAVTAERARDDAEASLRAARGQLEVIEQYLQTTLPEFERTRIKLAEASRLFREAETAHREAAEADKVPLERAKDHKNDEFTAATAAHEPNADARIQLNRTRDGKLAEIGTKEGEHTALIEPATNKRADATRLRDEYDAEQRILDAAKLALDTARREKVSAEALRATTRQTIERAEAEQRRLRQATSDAQTELTRLQALPPPHTRPTVEGDEDLASRYKLEPGSLENAGKGANFNEDQMKAVVDTFRSELKRSGAWGNNFDFKVDKLFNKIEIWNTDENGVALTGPLASRIIIRPTLISFHGRVDDKIMQASLVVGDKLWADAGICIKSSSNSLKHGLIANAAHLKELGRIKKYKASTWFGEIGEGFNAANENVTAPRDTWTFGTNPFSHYNIKMHRLTQGADSHHDDPAKPVPRRTWFRDGPTTMAPQGGPIPAAT